jgi:hypothetical protein
LQLSPLRPILRKAGRGGKMEYDKDKIDEYTLALLFLVTWKSKGASRAWKGFDWETMNRLYEKGFIGDPRGKAKSVGITEDGFQKAEELFRKFFEKKK